MLLAALSEKADGEVINLGTGKDIAIGLDEVHPVPVPYLGGGFRVSRRVPYLYNLAIAVGDDEFTEFANKRAILFEEGLERLLKLLKDPEEVERTINLGRDEEWKIVSGKILADVGRLSEISGKINDLEKDALRARYVRSCYSHCWGWDEGYGGRAAKSYRELARSARDKIKGINKELENANWPLSGKRPQPVDCGTRAPAGECPPPRAGRFPTQPRSAQR